MCAQGGSVLILAAFREDPLKIYEVEDVAQAFPGEKITTIRGTLSRLRAEGAIVAH